MTITMYGRGQMVIPAKLRKLNGYRSGDVFSIESADSDTVVLHRLKKAEAKPSKVKFYRDDQGVQVFSIGRPLDMDELKKALEELV